MTTRERFERKLELRQEWAEKRRQSANAVFERNRPFTSDYAFYTQPGHIPLRARIIRQEDRAFESLQMARHHDQCAAGIERALNNSIFSDDADAVEALEAKIKANEEKRDKMRTINKLYRKADRAGLAALGVDYDHARAKVEASMFGDKAPFPPFALSNLGGVISKDRKRLEYLKQRREREVKADAATNGVLIEECQTGYVRVTFSEKPDREVLNALRAAGFFWGGGSWAGKAESLPACVSEMAA